jgi:hypothetical protein
MPTLLLHKDIPAGTDTGKATRIPVASRPMTNRGIRERAGLPTVVAMVPG